MNKEFCIFGTLFILLICIDQGIKYFIIHLAGVKDLDSFILIKEGAIISIALVFNKGVAFSFLSFLGDYLKFIQIAFIIIIAIILIVQKSFFKIYFISFAFILGGGFSNVTDRFLHGAVVDYIYYHYGFNFPIFNLADVLIDCGIALFIIQNLFFSKKKNLQPKI